MLLAPVNASGTKEDPLYEYVRDLNKEAEDLEAGRLFYVAATRAQNRLHLLACAKCDKEGATKNPNSRSLVAKAWFIAERFVPAQPQVQAKFPVIQEIQTKTYIFNRLSSSWRLPEPPASVNGVVPTEANAEEQIEFSWAGERARHVGTIVHRWVQQIANNQLLGWTTERIESLGPQIQTDLVRRGLATDRNSVDHIINALKNSVSDERGKWVLGPHAESKSEYRIRVKSRTLVVDRYFVDESGEKWIVDFKTGVHGGGSIQEFLDRERTRYSVQLSRYGGVLGVENLGLYFPMSSGWRLVSPIHQVDTPECGD